MENQKQKKLLTEIMEADAKDGLYKQQTPVERLADYVRSRYETTTTVFENLVSNLLEKEKRNIKEAIMYALDEDGHTGEWKIKFANDYVNNLNKQ